MLTQDLRDKLAEKMKNNPKEAINMIQSDPHILEILLNANEEAEREKNEKIKYVNMTMEMDRQLKERANQLKTTQGALIGAGILLLLALLKDE
jgi:hypothetical protein